MFLTTTAACTNTLKYLLLLVCLKKIYFLLKVLNQIGSRPFYFVSQKEAKRPPPHGSVVWRTDFCKYIMGIRFVWGFTDVLL